MKKSIKDKKELKKIFKKVLITLIVYFIVFILYWFPCVAGSIEDGRYQFLNSLDYNVLIKDDGSADVTEIWDINIRKTTTLFKSFAKKFEKRYGEITNVSVKDLDRNVEFYEYGGWVYYAPKDYFYAATEDDYSYNPFEIGWGTGEEYSGHRRFEVKYTITDVIKKYNDLDEFYWQFLGAGDNAVPASKVTGRVTWPKEVSNIENIRVWGHGAVNGRVDIVDKKTVSFTIKNLSPRAMLEIRTIVTEDIVDSVVEDNRLNYNRLSITKLEEDRWAKETNDEILNSRRIIAIGGIVEILFILSILLKITRLYKIRNDKDLKKHIIKYFRDIPRDGQSTPSEALYLTRFHKKRLYEDNTQQKAIAAIILDLALKKVIKITVKEDKTYITIINKAIANKLPNDEKEVYDLLKAVAGFDKEFEVEELSRFAKTRYSTYATQVRKVVDNTRKSLYNLKLIDKANEKAYAKGENKVLAFSTIKHIYLWFVFAHIMVWIIPFINRVQAYAIGYGLFDTMTYILIGLFPIALIYLYYLKVYERMYKNIAVLTQEGIEEKEKWNGLKRYLNDYSLIKDKDIPDLVLWEKYLVFATAFGIADKVIESIKADYPYVFGEESWDEEQINAHPVIYFACNPIYHNSSRSMESTISRISSDVTRAYSVSKTEMAKHTSSGGSGGGGGFSGGRRRRRWPVAGMGGR